MSLGGGGDISSASGFRSSTEHSIGKPANNPQRRWQDPRRGSRRGSTGPRLPDRHSQAGDYLVVMMASGDGP